jgi:hypothetical protein
MFGLKRNSQVNAPTFNEVEKQEQIKPKAHRKEEIEISVNLKAQKNTNENQVNSRAASLQRTKILIQFWLDDQEKKERIYKFGIKREAISTDLGSH